MFDNTKPNVILLSDIGNQIPMEKTIGPFKIAKQLRDAGFEVAVVHHLMTFSVSEIKHILTNLISSQTLFVGVNNYFYKKVANQNVFELIYPDPGSIIPHGKEYNIQIKNLLKEINPNCKLVLGGPSASDVEHNKIFDYVLLGYAEISSINLAKHLLDSTTKLEKSKKSIFGPIIVDDSKAESYDFVNHIMEYQDHDAILDNETMVMEVGRGCIFKCKFCSYPLNGKKKLDFIRVEENLYRELMTNYEKYGTTRYTVSDDTLNDSVEKCEMLYNLRQKLPFQPEFWAYIRLDLLAAHPETIDMLYQSGLRAPFYGIESLNEESAKFIGKGGSRDRLIDTLKFIKKKYGNSINQTGSFIFGLPRESLKSMEQTAEWLLSEDNPLDTWDIFPLMLRDTNLIHATNGFISDFDLNWKKYGYTDTGSKSLKYFKEGAIVWRNEYTDFNYVTSYIEEINKLSQQKKINRVGGRIALVIASLTNIKLEDIFNKRFDEVDWHLLDKLKLQKTLEYKNKLFYHCNIPEFCRKFEYNTFSDFLKSIEYYN